MKQKSKSALTTRREFLKGVAVAGATAAIATKSKSAAAETERPAKKQVAAQPKGYRETAHIRTYYDRARI